MLRREHVTQVFDPRRRAIRIRRRPDGDHRLEVAVRLDAHDLEAVDGL
jgi:hypothetical protein